MALISLGWIFFRANSLDQARQMFSTILVPANYLVQNSNGGFYCLVIALAVGYGCVLLLRDALGNASEEQGGTQSRLAAALARHRWYWVPPLYVMVLLILLVLNTGPSTNAAEFMYRGF
jgi:hypothetical protein